MVGVLLAGPIPTSIGDLPSLVELQLHNNKLSGEVFLAGHVASAAAVVDCGGDGDLSFGAVGVVGRIDGRACC